jgi:NAD-dependent deacetylase
LKTLTILSGAGLSAESGIKTFRDSDGLWENHDVMEVASIAGARKNPKLVFEFYNQRRRQLQEVIPNLAHQIIAELEEEFKVQVITQNVDDLHERAGSRDVLHLHGELLSACTWDKTWRTRWINDLYPEDRNEEGELLRPDIVWFGEDVPNLSLAATLMSQSNMLIVIGTSLQVYPAAGLIDFTPANCASYLIDLHADEISVPRNFTVIQKTASEGMAYWRAHFAK